MRTVPVFSASGSVEGQLELPPVFETPVRPDIIQKAYINLESHRFQPKGTHPTAGMDVVARSNDPPTGRGVSRIAKMRGGGGGRQGQAGGVASVRGGRQAHPPKVQKVIHKKINRKENRLALCSAIAATGYGRLVESRGHRVGSVESFPVVLSDAIESVARAQDLIRTIESLGLSADTARLRNRKARTGKSALRGRPKKAGKSILFVVSAPEKLAKAAGSIPGVDVRAVRDLSVLDLAPGSTLIRLVIYSAAAMREIAAIKSPHLELMVKVR